MIAGAAPTNDCNACGVACGGGGTGGAMQYVGTGAGEYMAETTYKYVGNGGDFSNARRKRDFTCLICASLSLLLGLLCICWFFWPMNECTVDADAWQYKWNPAKQARCCALQGIGCTVQTDQATAAPTSGPVDPYNCADDKSEWQAAWSLGKKQWCCRVHGQSRRGCGHDAAILATTYACDAGFANFVKGWSTNKKVWCCANGGKGCPLSGSLNPLQATNLGYGAGAGDGIHGAPIAPVSFTGFR